MQWVEDILSTLWCISPVIMDTEGMVLNQELVKIQETGICSHQHAHKVINNLICFITETIIHLFRTKRYTKFLQIFSTVTCQALSSPSNGGRTYNKNAVGGRYPVDTVVTFTCNSGYSLSGSSTRKCQTSGHWNNNSPTCNRSNKNYIILLNRM